jgi:hypothetical protein
MLAANTVKPQQYTLHVNIFGTVPSGRSIFFSSC